ncbi:hypothetical protein C0992_011990 [Termitomyces sp. T32_za158]|nr:hypothetical protein C0992_011990 [Termitomyces sp. T32_za158]
MSNTQNNKLSKGQWLIKKARAGFFKSRISLAADTQADESTSPSLCSSTPHSMSPAMVLIVVVASSVTDHSSNTMIKDRLQTVWNGIELLLKMVEKPLSGTSVHVPVALVNALLELKTAVSQNNDKLDVQIVRITERLNAIKDAKDQKSNFSDLTKDFAG